MADLKITELAALTTPAVGDLAVVVDITSVAATKQITLANLMSGITNAGNYVVTGTFTNTGATTLNGGLTMGNTTTGITLGTATTGISLPGAMTDGILIAGACGDNAIEIKSACTDSAIDINTGGFATGLKIDADGTTAVAVTSAFTGVNMISLAGTGSTSGIIISGACAIPLNITGAFTTGITIAADGTTGVSITSAFSGTNMVSLAGTGSNAGIIISGACGKGVEITGSCTTGIGILTGTYTTGISIAGTTTTALAIGACTSGLTVTNATQLGVNVSIAALTAGDSYSGIRSAVTAAAANNGYGAAGYFDTTVSGTQGGTFVYGLGSWINLSTYTTSGVKYLCAQDNGVWQGTDNGEIADLRVVFGMRMESVIAATDHLNFPFSINTDNSGITAIFDVNTTSDLGIVTNAGTDDGTLIPILRDNSGNMRYVKVYTAA